MPREKSRYRDKRSSSYSSDSSYERRKTKSKHKRRSRTRDRSECGNRRKRSTSRPKHKRRSYTRSLSKERYDTKSRRRSSSRSKSKRSKRTASRERSRSISSSRSRTKYNKSGRKHRRRSHSSSSQSSNDIEHSISSKRINLDDTETKVEKAIKAAEAAGLTMTKIPSYEYKDVEVKADMPTIYDRNLLAELNSDVFVQKSFTSRSKKQLQNIVIDLNAETIKVPESEIKVETDDSIINFDEIPNAEELKELWVKKLYQYRKKMLKGEI